MISVQKLEKRYEAVHAVKGVSFDVARGDIVGLLGQNGAGKTTVMKVLTGYLEPTAGTITVGGVDVLQDRIGVQRQIGYLPENAPLYPEMLVQEYLLMMCELRSLPTEKHLAAVSDAVRATGLTQFLTRPIATLSKGYRQRVGLAQAILHKPEVLVLDEPTNGLDPVQIQEIRGLIRRLAQHSTIILSTHILQEVEAVCNRVVILINGELAADSALTDLLKSKRVRVSVKTGTDGVAVALGKVSGVSKVTRRGADPDAPGHDLWVCDYAGEHAPVPAVIEAAVAQKWTLGGVAPEVSNLETVFRTLMSEKAVATQEKAA
jgi:ABC-2 type transport system ATP-binding protein